MLNKEIKYIEISQTPELLRLAEQVQQSNQITVLTKDGVEVLEVRPAKPIGKRHGRSGILTKDDPLSKLVGALASEEPTDAARKHEYLGEPHPSA